MTIPSNINITVNTGSTVPAPAAPKQKGPSKVSPEFREELEGIVGKVKLTTSLASSQSTERVLRIQAQADALLANLGESNLVKKTDNLEGFFLVNDSGDKTPYMPYQLQLPWYNRLAQAVSDIMKKSDGQKVSEQ